jgi:NADPH-dependent 2,4-dienoyl-CoA reductase/sulfur reductase-like enzyme/rhodanese-related sulfurtransferase
MASKKVLIVGGVAGGASCAARLRRMDEHAEIFLYERSGYVSFANCGLPYYLGGVIENREALLVAKPERFRDVFNVEVRVNREVVSIDREAKTVEVHNVLSDERSTESYDVLVLAPGAAPIRPPIEGIDLPGVFCLRNMEDTDQISAWLADKGPEKAVVVGGGYVGLEMVENLVARGIDVTLIEKADQPMGPMDPEMLAPLHGAFEEKNVEVKLNCGVATIKEGREGMLHVEDEHSSVYPADIVIMAIGVKPEVDLARDAGLEIGQRGGIRVDEQMRTSDASILAVGDAVEVRDYVTGEWTLVPLAGPANRQGRIAADVISGRDARFRGTQGTAVVGLFGVTLASTGANEKRLKAAGKPYKKVYTYSMDHAGYYPGASPIAMKLLYEPESGRLLGAQAVGQNGVEKRIDVIAMALQKEGTVYDLEEAELCYAPQYGSAKDPVNVAGFVAGNALRGDVTVVHWDDWQARREAGDLPFVLDVRPSTAVASAAVPDTANIPLGELRARMDELPKDREIWVHCGVGLTSYIACRVLLQHGYQVSNLSGGITWFKMCGLS